MIRPAIALRMVGITLLLHLQSVHMLSAGNLLEPAVMTPWNLPIKHVVWSPLRIPQALAHLQDGSERSSSRFLSLHHQALILMTAQQHKPVSQAAFTPPRSYLLSKARQTEKAASNMCETDPSEITSCLHQILPPWLHKGCHLVLQSQQTPY